MIKRYSPSDISSLWTEEAKMSRWLEIELAVIESLVRQGKVPSKDYDTIKRKATFNVDRVHEIEKEVHHDVIAFLTVLSENVGDASRHIHQGMTSSDILDTALSMQMRDAGVLILKDIKRLLRTVAKKARKYKYALQMGRTHGVHAELTTFGLKLAFFYDEIMRNHERMIQAVNTISVGKLSGAVGTFEHITPKVEAYVCRKLRLKPAPITTQIISRDRHAEYMLTLAMIASSIERFSVECRHLQRTEVREVEEFFDKEQKGSSAMPHKRNPITFERLTGLSRVVRSHVHATLENISLWHERDISHSSVERIIIPDSTIATCYSLRKLERAINSLYVYPENMLKNIALSYGLVFSQSLLLALTQKGMSREVAYRIVQKDSMDAWQLKENLQSIAKRDNEVCQHLTEDEINDIFSTEKQISKIKSSVDTIFNRVNI